MNIRFAIVILMTFCFACDFVQEPIVEYDYTDIDDPSQNQTVLDSGSSDGTSNNTVLDSGTSDGTSTNTVLDSGSSDGTSTNTVVDAGTDNGSDPTDNPDGGVDDSNDPLVGSTPTSCGSPSQGLTPVDCTENGDVNASCVFSNHCVCSVDDGFRCEVADPDSTLGGLAEECEPGSVCVVAP